MLKKIFQIVFGLLFFSSTSCFAGIYTYAKNSLLANGKWVKIKITDSGVYKLTYQNISQMGFSDPSKVRVYGYGGAMLSEAFGLPKWDNITSGDLPEVSVYKGADYILFWGQGTTSWAKDDSNMFIHNINPYSTAAYYFLTDSQGAPSNMPVAPAVSNAVVTIQTFNDYRLHEKDLVNVGHTGREFYGEDFSLNTTQTFPFTVDGVTDSVWVTTDFISKNVSDVYYKVFVNNEPCISNPFPRMNVGSQDIQYTSALSLKSNGLYLNRNNLNTTFNIKISYGQSGDLNCRLNYIRLNMKRALKLYGSYTPFRSIHATGKIARYEIQNANPNVVVWDISDGKCTQMPSQINGALLNFNAESKSNKPKEFVAVDVNGSFLQPTFAGNVPNQNLHALPQTDMVIICPSEFNSAAEKLAQYHRDPQKDNLRVTIVHPEAIYNEFSSGTPDATAYRWFLKMFYDRATSENDKPKYLLLLGDGTFDNRLLGTEWLKSDLVNKILTYQSKNSLEETNSYVADDYFGLLDDFEGASIEASNIDIGIGRMPVRNLSEANNVVDKTINYANNTKPGTWKNNLCYVADDGDANSHMNHANALCTYLEDNYKFFITNKIFFDSYKKEFTSTGATYPTAKKRLFDLINSGLMTLSYTGHGSTNSWAVEQIMTIADIRNLSNSKLPLWITATCDFSRFDDYNTSAGEEVLLNPKGGGIALITTTRVVFSSQNDQLNRALHRLLFSRGTDGKRFRLGDIIRQTKNSLGTYDQNKLSFTLLGDPALKLVYPEYKMEITTLNDKPIKETQTISALSEVRLSGNVLTPDGSTIDTNFNGTINPTVFDCEEEITTLNNDQASAFKYNDRNKVLFIGKDTVKNGRFSFKFMVPKDMSYSNKSGRINLYCSDSNGNEGQGYFENFLLYGTNPNATLDFNGPTFRNTYLNNTDFRNGGTVNETPILVADIEDESGINVSGTGIGHDMTLIIDGDASNASTLNNYFEAKSGVSNAGRVVFNIPELSEGHHSLNLRVWDIQNNSSNTTIDCVVKKGYAPRIYDLWTLNPTRISNGQVLFYLKHDRPKTNISVKVSIYNLSGKEIWTHTETGSSDLLSAFPIKWDMKEKNGNTVTPAIYLYKASVFTESNQENSLTKKLIILPQ